MRLIFVFLCVMLCAFTSSLFSSTELSIDTSAQVNITYEDFYYSYDVEGMALFSVVYPVLVGVKYDYQYNFQRIALLGVVRTLPKDWSFRVDLALGGGLASIAGSPMEYAFFTAGIMPKYFIIGKDKLDGAFIYSGIFFMDITTAVQAYSFINGSVGVGLYIW